MQDIFVSGFVVRDKKSGGQNARESSLLGLLDPNVLDPNVMTFVRESQPETSL